MIGVSRLYCGVQESSDHIRYGRHGRQRRPIVVWNCTRRCNLACAHCYASACSSAADDELDGRHARAMIDDLAAFGAPVLLFSGGEPLMRPNVLDLAAYSAGRGLRTVLSTNGTLIDASMARRLAEAGVAYVGISLDGLEPVNDAFRGRAGAFAAALAGIEHCMAAGVKVGLRLTLSRRNFSQLAGIFDLIEHRRVPRVCFYHLVYSGRGDAMRADDLTHQQMRDAMDQILARTAAMHAAGRPTQVLTVDNHADGAYLYLRLLRENPARAAEAMDLLRRNGGNGTGQTIGCVSWNGDILPDQFWRQHVLGNVRARPFSQVWADESQPLLAAMRRRDALLHGRCTRCRFMDICNGNFRARAESAGDMWGDDPACYLSDQEIAPQAS
jgi:radical SAM protein with 4Fe4S-binding SPASM domain